MSCCPGFMNDPNASLAARHELSLNPRHCGIDRRQHVAHEFREHGPRWSSSVGVHARYDDRRTVVATPAQLLPGEQRLGQIRIREIMAGDTEPVPDQKPLVRAAKLRLANSEGSGARRFLQLPIANVGPYRMFLDYHQVLRIDELCAAPLMAVVA